MENQNMENPKKIYEVTVSWTESATIEIEAESAEQARDIAYEREDTPDGEYVGDSFIVDSVKDENNRLISVD